ncbi:MAG: TrkH family potassium uptake protein, partial [Pseudomonadota bacterium]
MAARGQPRAGFGASVLRLPLFLLLLGVFSASMLVPAVYAGMIRELVTGRAFLYSGILGLITFGLIAFAHAGRDPRHGT